MTSKESDIKLAKDIARIKIAAGTIDNASTSTISAETVLVMKEMDAAHEGALAKELGDTILSDPVKMDKVTTVITEAYVKSVIVKLKIRKKARHQDEENTDLGAKKKVRNFTAEDYAAANRLHADEAAKAADLIQRAIAAGETTAMINAAAAEAYCYNIERAKKEILALLPADLRKTPINMEIVEFTSLATEAVEYLMKSLYYGSWIYERFQPIGIIKVSLV